MLAANTNHTRKERKIRRKKLLRAYREDQNAKMWNKVMDEVGPCNVADLESESFSFDFLDPVPDPEFDDLDEDYPNKLEIIHNIFECD